MREAVLDEVDVAVLRSSDGREWRAPTEASSLACARMPDGALRVCTRLGSEAFVFAAGTVERLPSDDHAVRDGDGEALRVQMMTLRGDGALFLVDADGSVWQQLAGAHCATLVLRAAEPALRSSRALLLSGGADSADPFVAVACGTGHCLALTASGRLFTWGSGERGQLGHGDDESRAAPAPCAGARRISAKFAAVAAGGAHSAAVCTRGVLFCWGDGGDGRLGLDRERPRRRLEPTPLPAPPSFALARASAGGEPSIAPSDTWRLPACGARHTAGVTADGAVLTWGRGDWGRLVCRTPKPTPAILRTLARLIRTVAHQGHGRPHADEPTPRHVLALAGESVARVALGEAHSAAITANGKVYAWGAAWGGVPAGAPPHVSALPPPAGAAGAIVDVPTALGPRVAAAFAVGGDAYVLCEPLSKEAVVAELPECCRVDLDVGARAARAKRDDVAGPSRGVLMWQRALMLLAEEHPSLYPLAMRIGGSAARVARMQRCLDELGRGSAPTGWARVRPERTPQPAAAAPDGPDAPATLLDVDMGAALAPTGQLVGGRVLAHQVLGRTRCGAPFGSDPTRAATEQRYW